MNVVVEILRSARALIEDPAHWTQHMDARNECGERISPFDDNAVAWCMLGAVDRTLFDFDAAADPYFDSISASVYDVLRGVVPTNRNVSLFNDNHSHRSVLAAFDRAIAEAESKSK